MHGPDADVITALGDGLLQLGKGMGAAANQTVGAQQAPSDGGRQIGQ